jgi:hypothetical protein
VVLNQNLILNQKSEKLIFWKELWDLQSWLVGSFYFRKMLLLIIIINYTILKQFWIFRQLRTERVENELNYGSYNFMSKKDPIKYASEKVQKDLD